MSSTLRSFRKPRESLEYPVFLEMRKFASETGVLPPISSHLFSTGLPHPSVVLSLGYDRVYFQVFVTISPIPGI